MDDRIDLTPRQRELLELLRRGKRRIGPTIRELCAAMEIKSTNGVLCLLRVLVKKGWVEQLGEASTRGYRRAVVGGPGHAPRAAATVGVVRHETERGGRVLVHVKTVLHGNALATRLRMAGVRVAVVFGETPLPARRQAEDALREGRVDAIVGTVYGEGVDLPWLRCVVNAAGGRSWVAVVQGLRNLTPWDGEGVPRKPMTPVPWAPVYDFVDLGIQVLEDHSAARAAEYHRHPAFRVRRVPADLFGGEP